MRSSADFEMRLQKEIEKLVQTEKKAMELYEAIKNDKDM
jgi:hypothetical protein